PPELGRGGSVLLRGGGRGVVGFGLAFGNRQRRHRGGRRGARRDDLLDGRDAQRRLVVALGAVAFTVLRLSCTRARQTCRHVGRDDGRTRTRGLRPSDGRLR